MEPLLMTVYPAVIVRLPVGFMVALLVNVFAAIVRLPVGFMVAVLVNVPFVVIAKSLKLVKPLKEVLVWVKSSVSIKFKLSDETIPKWL